MKSGTILALESAKGALQQALLRYIEGSAEVATPHSSNAQLSAGSSTTGKIEETGKIGATGVTEATGQKGVSAAAQDLSHCFNAYLHLLAERHYFSHIDLYFSEFICQKQYLPLLERLRYRFLLLLLSRAYGYGHTALPFHYLYQPHKWFNEQDDAYRLEVIEDLLQFLFQISLSDLPKSVDEFEDDVVKDRASSQLIEAWAPILKAIAAPIICSNEGIYLDRNYAQEGEIVQFFGHTDSVELTASQQQFLRTRLDDYFGVSDTVNWQKLAAANALLNRVSIISGGPGTGKTTTVFKILQTLIDQHYWQSDEQIPFSILLAAPTGKAAARLSESILGQMQQLQEIYAKSEGDQRTAFERQLATIPTKGQTLHRLLMIHPFTQQPQFHQNNPLNFDLLIVDEASMIDQKMLVQLIRALPENGQIIFLGDKDQLASVEAGAIMHELCVSENYSEPHFKALSTLMSERLPKDALVHSEKPSFNYLSFLKHSYRFDADSALGKLAKIINNQTEAPRDWQWHTIQSLLKKEQALAATAGIDAPLTLTELPMDGRYFESQIQTAFAPYLAQLQTGNGADFARETFKVFTQIGVLSARRTGEYGAIRLNQQIREILFPQLAHYNFFHGLPVMVTQNSAENQLFNGDVGLILRDEKGELRAYFEGVEGARAFSIHALPKFEPAFAMTIHKSQGSEFTKVLLFLGAEGSPFLTKELFYTGITRAKKRVDLFAGTPAILSALSGRVDRFSFIHQRLNALQSEAIE